MLWLVFWYVHSNCLYIFFYFLSNPFFFKIRKFYHAVSVRGNGLAEFMYWKEKKECKT